LAECGREEQLTVIVTGAAGFIGYSVAKRLLERDEPVIGVDNFAAYYDPQLKRDRVQRLTAHPAFKLAELDIVEADALSALVGESRPSRIVHLAAQVGVRHSIHNPFAYERSNVAGHLSVLEAARHCPEVQHLVYASSSSVYGERSLERPFRESDVLDAPASLYAATKQACELMSGAYSRLYGLRQTGLRFFTVYGPWGRPDMAYFSFTQNILEGRPIEVFNHGEMARDFTFIDDIVDGILDVLDHPPDQGEHRIFNIGDCRPIPLMRMIEILEEAVGRSAVKLMKPKQPGDVTATCADIGKLNKLAGYVPKVTLEEGLPRFVRWYRDYYGSRA
jgi:UDP-glucuronate 4-epimerase